MQDEKRYRYSEILKEVGFLNCRIRGVSMLPFLRQERDVVLVVRHDSRPKKYDVIMFWSNPANKYILHRVLKVYPDHFVTYGDNCIRGEYVPDDCVLGVLKGYYKGKRFISTDSRAYKLKIWLYYHVPFVKRLFYLFQHGFAKIRRTLQKDDGVEI